MGLMASKAGVRVLTDAQWAVLEPLVLEVRPRGRTPHRDLRRTMEAIIWRCRSGAPWRDVPPELGDWINAAQTFIRWARKGVWERLLDLAQARAGGIDLGMAFLDGTNIRAHPKAAGAPKKGGPAPSETAVKRLDALVAAMAPRRSRPRTRAAGP
jgi:transposase